MSYLDESEYDDRARDGRSGDDRSRDERSPDDRARDDHSRDARDSREPGGRRASRPARPAWDAATYGTPDDLRRSRPPASSRGRGSSPDHGYSDPVDPDPYRSPYSPDPYPAEPYPPNPYPAAPVTPEPYLSGSYAYPAATSASPYAPEAFAPDPYAAPSLPDSDPYAASAYLASDPYPGSSSPAPDPYPPDPYPPDPYPNGRHDQNGGYTRDGGPATAEQYPGGMPADEAGPPEPKGGRAGRNLPAAIGVGVLLGGIAVASLFVWRQAFLGVLVVAVGIGVWELVRAIRTKGANPPLIPLVAGGALMMGLAWWGHGDALTFGLMVTVLAAMVWRLADGAGEYERDVIAATLVAVYLPFLAGFAALLATPSDGDLRVLVMLAGVVLSDTGGYIAGVLFGRHPMAPLVSPKKSWEGLVGSLVASGAGGAVLLHLLFHVSFAHGAVFGLAICVAAVIGDLGESMLKRDLGVKDMSQLLPGHGGLMDRLDSILLAAPTAYVLFLWLVPAT